MTKSILISLQEQMEQIRREQAVLTAAIAKIEQELREQNDEEFVLEVWEEADRLLSQGKSGSWRRFFDLGLEHWLAGRKEAGLAYLSRTYREMA